MISLIVVSMLGQYCGTQSYYPRYYPSYYSSYYTSPTYYTAPTYYYPTAQVKVVETPIQYIKVGENVRDDVLKNQIVTLSQQVNSLVTEKQAAQTQAQTQELISQAVSQAASQNQAQVQALQNQMAQTSQALQSITTFLQSSQQSPPQYAPQQQYSPPPQYPPQQQYAPQQYAPQQQDNSQLSLFNKYKCQDCHTQSRQKGGVAIFGLDGQILPDLSMETKKDIYVSMKNGTMPYKSKVKVSKDDLQTTKDWILEE